ncbi:glutathione S-transferase [Colletotrichum eremochloae]|nr:glutathione S-transferase [Colletotrichum eremochloae]
MEPIKIYGHVAGPHPWKVIILLKELGVPYQIEFLTAEEMKSGTIIEYLEDMYDQDDKLKYSTFPQKYHQKNWKDYQISGHDLFLGQKAYFTMFHTDQDITSVHEHYGNMVRWVLGVVERQLVKTGHPYLVGDKCTYADLMYIPFHLVLADKLMRNVSNDFEQEWKEKFPRCYEWNMRIVRRESVQQALEEKYRAMDTAGWPR